MSRQAKAACSQEHGEDARRAAGKLPSLLMPLHDSLAAVKRLDSSSSDIVVSPLWLHPYLLHKSFALVHVVTVPQSGVIFVLFMAALPVCRLNV